MRAARSDAPNGPRTVFAGGVNPFSGLGGRSNVAHLPTPAKPDRRRKPEARHKVDAAKLSIAADPCPDERHPNHGRGRLDALFAQLRPGQCLCCEPEDARRLANNLRHWLKVRGRTERIVYRPRAGNDNRGRVWLLPREQARPWAQISGQSMGP